MKTLFNALQTVQPSSVLKLKSDDNGTRFPKGFVLVYKNTGGPEHKLTLGRVTNLGQIEKQTVAISELKDVEIVQTPTKALNLEGPNPHLLKAGDILYSTDVRGKFQQDGAPSFMMVEQISGLRTHTLHIVMRGQLGDVQKHKVRASELENVAVLC